MWPLYPEIFGTPSCSPNPDPVQEAIEEAQIISAMESAHAFPGYYPIAVIAKGDDAFRERLHVALGDMQGEAPFRVTERPSTNGTYISYRVEVHVESAHVARVRKNAIAGIAGVLVML